jgi:chromosome segregation ATPase
MGANMDFAQAAKHAQSMKNQFRAFETLEEVLTASAQAAASIGAARRELAAVKDVIVKVTGDRDRAYELLDQTLAENERATAEAAAAAAAQVEANAAEITRQLEEIESVQDRLQRRREASAETIAGLEAAEAAARARTEKAEADFAGVRERVNAAAA